MVICVKFHNVGTLASLKTNLPKNFNLSVTAWQTNRPKNYMSRQTDKQMVRTPIRHDFINNDMMMVICVKFYDVGTSALVKTNLT